MNKNHLRVGENSLQSSPKEGLRVFRPKLPATQQEVRAGIEEVLTGAAQKDAEGVAPMQSPGTKEDIPEVIQMPEIIGPTQSPDANTQVKNIMDFFSKVAHETVADHASKLASISRADFTDFMSKNRNNPRNAAAVGYLMTLTKSIKFGNVRNPNTKEILLNFIKDFSGRLEKVPTHQFFLDGRDWEPLYRAFQSASSSALGKPSSTLWWKLVDSSARKTA